MDPASSYIVRCAVTCCIEMVKISSVVCYHTRSDVHTDTAADESIHKCLLNYRQTTTTLSTHLHDIMARPLLLPLSDRLRAAIIAS